MKSLIVTRKAIPLVIFALGLIGPASQVQAAETKPMPAHSTDIAKMDDSPSWTIGDLVVSVAHTRVTPPGATIAAGYMSITNNGASDDVLLGGVADFAGTIEVHTMKMENDVMKMRKLKDGLIIPAGATVELKHGGEHLMFKQLVAPVKKDELKVVTLKFKEAGEVEVSFKAQPLMHH